MADIIGSFAEVSGRYRALLCDVWGCYHDGIRPFAAAVDALTRFRAEGGIVVLLTNAPRPAPSVAAFLDKIGSPRESYDAILSSGEACQRAIRAGTHGTRFHYVGPERDLHMLGDVGFSPMAADAADAILCTGLDDDACETPDDYAERIEAWRALGLPMLCANPDIVVDRGPERLWCAGAIAMAYERAGGEVIWYGKPNAPIYDQAFALLAELAGGPIAREQVVAAGDGIATDVAGAIAYGIDAIFVSGGLAAAEVGTDPEAPDPDRLRAYLTAHGAAPRHAIGRLR